MGQYQSRMAPPLEPGALPPPAPGNWPTVIGVIAIVYASFGILGAIWALIAPFMMSAMTSMMPAEPSKQMAASMAGVQKWMGLSAASNALNLAGAAVLLLAGIGLLRRRGWSRSVAIVWAVFKMAFAVLAAVVGYLIAIEQMAVMQQQMQSKGGAAMPVGFMQAFLPLGIGISIAVGWAFPIFMLVWMGRGRVRAEVAGWETASAGPPG
jgi:hypothetical protein